jgi:excisionase family DNA binding protein
MGEALLSPREAAEALMVSERTLRDLKRLGAIRYVAITGRRIAYRRDDVADFINTRVRCDEQVEQPKASKRRASVSGAAAANIVPFSQRRRP